VNLAFGGDINHVLNWQKKLTSTCLEDFYAKIR
jgi:hypothetical protein